MPDTQAAVFRQKHRLGTVKDRFQIKAGLFERLREILGMFDHRRAGCSADQFIAIKRPDQNRVFTVAVGLQIAAFVFEIPVVQIGKGVEHGDAQTSDIVQHIIQFSAC